MMRSPAKIQPAPNTAAKDTARRKHLVKMANDIGHFFGAEPEREDAIAGIANHIAKFWTKRMRDKLTAPIKRDGDAGLDELPREALRRLAAQPAAQASAVQPAAAKQAAH